MTTQPSLVLCELGKTDIPGLESYSPFCLKVHRALALAKLTYASRHASNPAAYAKLNPAKQVPVLLVDGEPIADSSRIVAKLAELAPGALERGLDVRAHGEAFLWEEFADTVLSGFVVAARWADDDNWAAVSRAYFEGMPWPVRKLVVPRLRARVVGTLRARDVTTHGMAECWARFERTLDALEARAPSRESFWLGTDPTFADVSLFAQLRSLATPLTPRQKASIEARARLSAYVARVDSATRAELAVSAAHALRGRQAPAMMEPWTRGDKSSADVSSSLA